MMLPLIVRNAVFLIIYFGKIF